MGRASRWSFAAVACALACFCPAVRAQELGELPGIEYNGLDAGPPVIASGGGDFFSQDLGTLFRIRYSTESYGQEDTGNLDLGTMKVTNFDDAIGFFDGQLTLNDEQGAGFNIGVGFRWLSWLPVPGDQERVTGFSLWADGTSTSGGNFYPQVGVSYESLGDVWDVRVNSYIPIGPEKQLGAFEPTGAIGFQSNFLSEITVADEFSSFNVGEVEFARRLGRERDAWAFASPYVLANDEQDTAGYKVGLRGYAYPDLLLQVAVSDDDIFATNATFSLVWFVGRTRTDFQPACDVRDRMREPVMRNDYVALGKDQVTSGIPLVGADGNTLRFVHVYSDAAPGGNGTYERPFDRTDEPNGGGSQAGDIILVWSDSQFNGNSTLALKDRQRMLGEGNGEIFTVNTLKKGVVVIPETRPGARDGNRPLIMNALGVGGAVQLADLNEVANLNFDGGVSAITSQMLGAGNPNLHDFDIRNTTGDAIVITPFTRQSTTNPAQSTVAGNVTIDDVVFDNIGGTEININSFTTADTTSPNVTLQETILISDITSTNGQGRGVWLRNTHANRTATILNYTNGTNGTAGSGGGDAASGVLVFEGTTGGGSTGFDGNVTLTNIKIFENTGFALDFLDIDAGTTTITNNNGLTYDGGAGPAGGLRFRDFDGTFVGNSSTITDGTQPGVYIGEGLTGDDSDGTFTFATSFTISSVDTNAADEAAFVIDGFTGTMTMNGTIANDTGRSVLVEGMSLAGTSATFSGNITETTGSQGILVNGNSGGTLLFSGNITQDLTGQNGITLTNNTGTDINFSGILDTDITGAGRAFTASGGGTLTVTNTGNVVRTADGRAVSIEDMTISNAGVAFSEVNVTSSTDHALFFQDNTGGPITIGTLGDDPGESGTVTAAGDVIVIDNSANVTVSGLIVNAAALQSGVLVNKTTTGTQTTNLNDLDINNGANGIEVTGNGTGTLNMTVNDATIDNSTAFGLTFDNIDAGTIQVNGTTIDGNNVNGSAVGVQILNSNATFNFDADTTIQEFSSTDFLINGGTPNVTFNGDIVNSSAVHAGDTTGRSLIVQGTTGGTRTFSATSSINDDNEGILITSNTGGTTSLLGDNTFNTGANTAVTITNNTGATISLSDLNIDTTSGTGLLATGGGTLTVLGTTNTIDTTTGTGLRIENMTIGAAGAAFQSVNVNGAANAIVLNTLGGTGQVSVGNATGAADSGGTLTTTGDAIVLTNTANVDLNNIHIANSGGIGVNINHTAGATTDMDVTISGLNLDASTGAGIDVDAADAGNTFRMRLLDSDLERQVTMDVTGSSAFLLLVDNTQIDTTTTGTVALAINFTNSAQNGDITIRDNSRFETGNASAMEFTANGTNIDIEMRIDDVDFVNNSGASPTAFFDIRGGATVDATVVNNSFMNSGAAVEFQMTSTGTSTRTNLDLDNNTAVGAGVYELNTINKPVAGFNFGVVDRDQADGNNIGTIDFNPINTDFEDIDGPLPQPIVP